MIAPQPRSAKVITAIAIAIGLLGEACASDDGVPAQEAATYAKVRPLLDRNCVICHSNKPAMAFYAKAPDGVTLDSAQDLARFAARVLVMATQTDQMPPGNLTGMTDAERKVLSEAIQKQWPIAK